MKRVLRIVEKLFNPNRSGLEAVRHPEPLHWLIILAHTRLSKEVILGWRQVPLVALRGL